jgi:hypothetical protein
VESYAVSPRSRSSNGPKTRIDVAFGTFATARSTQPASPPIWVRTASTRRSRRRSHTPATCRDHGPGSGRLSANSCLTALAPLAGVLRPFGLPYELAFPLLVIVDPLVHMVRIMLNVAVNCIIPALAAGRRLQKAAQLVAAE